MANMGAPEKKISPYFYAVVIGCLIALPAVMFLGYLLDLSAGDNGQIQIFELLSNSENYLSEVTIGGMFETLMQGGMTAKATVIGFFASLIVIVYVLMGDGKRYHRKGVEHGSGTGKSRFFVKPNLMMCNTSYIVTDPSGELAQACAQMLINHGYKIKIFNLNDMKHSSNYNPFHYLRDYNGEINPNNVIKMINVFMMNTKEEGASGGDPFWDDATRLLLSSLCFLLIETGTEEEQNFAGVLDLIHKAKVVEGKEEEKSELDYIFDLRKEAAPKALSVQYYEEFKQAAGKTMQSILISTTTKLQYFKLPDVRNLTATDNIHLEEMGDEYTALFIVIPSSDTTYNFLAAMMYTQLFDTLYDRAINLYKGRLPVHVRFVLDEFANLGKIPGIDKILATCRKFEISIQIILQNLSQLKKMYKEGWEEYGGNCVRPEVTRAI